MTKEKRKLFQLQWFSNFFFETIDDSTKKQIGQKYGTEQKRRNNNKQNLIMIRLTLSISSQATFFSFAQRFRFSRNNWHYHRMRVYMKRWHLLGISDISKWHLATHTCRFFGIGEILCWITNEWSQYFLQVSLIRNFLKENFKKTIFVNWAFLITKRKNINRINNLCLKATAFNASIKFGGKNKRKKQWTFNTAFVQTSCSRRELRILTCTNFKRTQILMYWKVEVFFFH